MTSHPKPLPEAVFAKREAIFEPTASLRAASGTLSLPDPSRGG
jgi:hypothetical protein